MTKRICGVLLIGFLACAHAANAPAAPSTAQRDKRFQGMISQIFPQGEIRPVDARSAEGGSRYVVFDGANGYARVTGPFNGADDFFLIHAGAADYVIFVEYNCGPACAQRVSAHRFEGDAPPVAVALTDVLDLSGVGAIRRSFMYLCLDEMGNFDSEKLSRPEERRDLPACPYVFSFSKKGAHAVLFRIQDADQGRFLLSVSKTKVIPQARFRWEGGRLIGAEPPDINPIFLNGNKMKVWF